MLYRPRSPATEGLSRPLRPRPPSHPLPQSRTCASSTAAPTSATPPSALSRWVSRSLRRERLLHGRSRSNRKRPYAPCCMRAPVPFRPSLRLLAVHAGARTVSWAIPSLIHPSREQRGQARSRSHHGPQEAPRTSCSSGNTKGSAVPPPARNRSHPGLRALRVRPNPSLQRTHCVRR